jgi:anti-sigma factor RsiW
VNAERMPTDETQEDFPADLVAYLDGELDAARTRAVEERLSSDAAYRRQLRELQQAWDLLDQLPKADVDETFTQTTLAMVAVSVSGEVEQAQVRRGRTRRWLRWTGSVAAVAAFAAGYVAVSIVVSRENRRLLRDLPVIERLDEYRYADSVEFLRQLEREGLFTEDEIPNEM